MNCFMIKKKSLLILLIFTIQYLNAQTNTVASPSDQTIFMDFRRQKTSDIIYSLARLCDKSVIIDESVNGLESFHFEDKDFDQALNRFAEACALYVTKKDGIYYVSKVDLSVEDSRITVNTEDTDASAFLKLLSRRTDRTVMFDSLPQVNVTVRLKNVGLEDILNLVLVKLPGYGLERIGEGFFIGKNASAGSKRNVDVFNLSSNEEKYSLSLQKCSFNGIIEALFKKAGKEYSLLSRNNLTLESLYFNEKSFDGLLELILQQAGCDYAVYNEIFYIFEVNKKDLIKKFKDIRLIELKNISCGVFTQLMPQDVNGSAVIKCDEKRNSVLVMGTASDIESVEKYIETIDVKANSDLEGKNLRCIKLKYIKSDELLASLPTSIQKNELTKTYDSSTMFFSGRENEYQELLKQLENLDKPKQQIKYQILVVQRQKTEGTKLNSSLSINDSEAEPSVSRGLTLSNIFNINFDVISHLGLQFAGSFNAELSEGKSRVLADTTLNGISGETITFSNTNTYRYRDIIVDTTGDLYTSTTREISSGLTLSINGWASGDDMVTVKIDAQVSKQGSSDSSSDTSNPPSTSEKKVSTNVRTKSGESVIIGGLFQQETDISEKRVPFLGRIPLVGNLFKHKTTSRADTEFVIYLVPFVEKQKASTEDRILHYRKKYAEGAAPAGNGGEV